MGGNRDGCNRHQANCKMNIFGRNKELTKYVKEGQPEKTMQLFEQMQQEGMILKKSNFCSAG
jgi:pentatricopeptide repeat protein